MPDASANTAFSPVAAARRLMRTARTAALATLDVATGSPFASLVTVATDPAGRPLLLLSRLAVHTRNAAQDPRVSLLFDDRSAAVDGDPLAGSRLTVTGRLVVIAADMNVEPAARRRFLARHPEAEAYAAFRDFAIWRLEVEQAHLVAGFGRINALAASDLLLDLTGADGLLSAEPEIIAHMNADHADATRHYATRLLGQSEADWRVVGCDPEGFDLAAPNTAGWRDARLVFPRLIRAVGPLRATLKELAENQG